MKFKMYMMVLLCGFSLVQASSEPVKAVVEVELSKDIACAAVAIAVNRQENELDSYARIKLQEEIDGLKRCYRSEKKEDERLKQLDLDRIHAFDGAGNDILALKLLIEQRVGTDYTIASDNKYISNENLRRAYHLLHPEHICWQKRCICCCCCLNRCDDTVYWCWPSVDRDDEALRHINLYKQSLRSDIEKFDRQERYRLRKLAEKGIIINQPIQAIAIVQEFLQQENIER